jgi:hypothetical protein
MIDCIETLGNIYRNGSRHVTRRVKLIETLNWESLFIPSWLSNCRSTNSPVGVNCIEGEAVAEQQPPRTSGCEAATSSRGL